MKEYISYEQALKMKNLGFNEPTIFAYDQVPMICTMSESPFKPLNYNSSSGGGYVSSPLWQQTFKWFRNKFNLMHEILDNPIDKDNKITYRFGIWRLNDPNNWYYQDDNLNGYSTYEEAEDNCLNMLIKVAEINTEVINSFFN